MAKKLTLAIMLASAVASASVWAANTNGNGTVNFTGEIVDKGCDIDSGSQNQSVDMGSVWAKTFTTAGDTSLGKDFTIKLINCPTEVTTNGATLRFDGVAASADNKILKLDDTSVATGVGIQIKDDAGNIVPLFADSKVYTLVEGTNELKFTARYISTAATVTAGAANSSTQFTVNYQ